MKICTLYAISLNTYLNQQLYFTVYADLVPSEVYHPRISAQGSG